MNKSNNSIGQFELWLILISMFAYNVLTNMHIKDDKEEIIQEIQNQCTQDKEK